MKKVIIIPARLNSTRLPNKVLLDLGGKSVIQRVYQQCKKVKNIDDIYIATDSIEVKKNCLNFTDNIILTDKNHQSGTDRIAEAITKIDCNIIINVQGDEPFIEPSLIDELINSFNDNNIVMSSAMSKIYKVSDLKNPNIVKVTVDKDNNAIYFSRSIIPHHRDKWDILLDHHIDIPSPLKFYRHLGIYGYTKEFLIKYAQMESTYLERIEKLEQLRVIENGYKIKMIETIYNSIGIDTEEDYKKALNLITIN